MKALCVLGFNFIANERRFQKFRPTPEPLRLWVFFFFFFFFFGCLVLVRFGSLSSCLLFLEILLKVIFCRQHFDNKFLVILTVASN